MPFPQDPLLFVLLAVLSCIGALMLRTAGAPAHAFVSALLAVVFTIAAIACATAALFNLAAAA